MAATPPLQIVGSPRTPPTPLHGSLYDHSDSPRRTSARLRQRRAFEDIETHKPARSPQNSRPQPQSPARTPQRKANVRRVQILSPTSPDSDTSITKQSASRSRDTQPFLSATTIFNEGMLPTPVKTPNKKQKMVSKSNNAARALFQDQIASDEIMPSPRKNRKNKRYNGFSLESFRAEDGNGGGIQIFTDSRDHVPEVDKADENPFVDPAEQAASSRKIAGTSKRRKVSEPKKLDPQVEDALQKDEGMVYVFRGKKVYRRFDDGGEEEEEIDATDLGLLDHLEDGTEIVKPMRTMTRKSIKPTRLFQTEEQKRARALEKEEEAAATDFDDNIYAGPNSGRAAGDSLSKPKEMDKAHRGKGKTRAEPNNTDAVNGKPSNKKGSPFDAWPRVKPGSTSSSSAPKSSRGRKRAASESFEEPQVTKV